MPLLSELIDSINFEQDALMLKDKMKQYALQYCEALAENYKQYRINMHTKTALLIRHQAERIAEPMRQSN